MRADGFQVICVGSIESLLQQDIPPTDVILLVDVNTVRWSGTSLQEQLSARGLNPPVIYLADCDSERTRSRAKFLGASGYFRKPVDEQALSDAITFAVQQGQDSPQRRHQHVGRSPHDDT